MFNWQNQGLQGRASVISHLGWWMLRLFVLARLLLQLPASQPELNLTQLIHDVWQTEEGLPQNAVHCIIQDNDDYIWFGTENGLVRFDGVRFDIYTEKGNPPVPHNFTSSLLAARDGTIWAGARTGGLWRRREAVFDEPFPQLATVGIWSLAETSDGSVWVGTNKGLFQVRDGQLVPVSGFPDSLDNHITVLAASITGALWIGTYDGNVALLQDGQVSVVLPGHRKQRGSGIKAFAENPATGELWIARDGAGLQLFRTNSVTTINLFPAEQQYLQTLHLDSEGALWIGTRGHGIIRYHQGSISIYDEDQGWPDNDVLSILQDREGSIWIGTHFAGLNRLMPGKAATFTKKEGLPVQTVSSVVRADAESLWVGTVGGGLLRYSNSQFTRVPLGRDNATDIRALLQTKDGSLWIGTYGAGLARRETNGSVRFFTRADGLASDTITMLFEASQGEVWIGTERDGLAFIQPSTGEIHIPAHPAFMRTHIRAMAEDSTGTFWIGTQNDLVRYSAGQFQVVDIPTAPDLSVRTLICDSEDTLWIGSRDDGLIRLTKGGHADNFSSSNGLWHNRIYDMVFAGEDLWLAGNQGIERVSVAELDRVAANASQRLATQLFTKKEGLRTAECGGDYSPSAALDGNGALWFGTREGLVQIDPKQNRKRGRVPNVLIRSVTVDNERFQPRSFNRVRPGATRLQIDYTALSLRNPANVFFKYRLENVDSQWVDAGHSREAVYYNLKPGAYRFRVQACNDEGIWNEAGATLAFAVAPRFYQALAFQVLAAAGTLSLLAAAYRWRVRSMRSRTRELETLVAVRTRDLQVFNEDLEERVRTRTLELRNAYENLQIELRVRHKAEQALARSEARLRRIVDSDMVGIVFWHKDGTISDANDAFLRMIGYGREDLERGLISWKTLTPPEFLPLEAAALRQIDATGVCSPFEKEYIRKDGSRLPVLQGGASLSADRERGVCFVLDISARKGSEEEVRRLNLLLEARVQERTNQLARANEQLAAEVTERKRVAVALAAFSHLGQKLHSARTEKEAATIVAETARSLIPHKICSIELYDAEGRLIPVLEASPEGEAPGLSGPHSSISVSIRNGSRVVGLLGLKAATVNGFSFDDSNTLQALGDYCGGALERIHAEEARREIERRFSTFMTNAPALAWMKNSDFRYVFTNESFQRFTGLTALEIESKTDFDLWPEQVASRMRFNDIETVASQSKRETHEQIKRHDGETRTLLTLRFLFTTGTGEQYVAGMAIDITEQKRAEDALHRLPQSILEAQETERRRVARELHDGVNQAIASIKFRIQTAEKQILRSDPKWQETCSKTKEMLDSVLQQVRRLSRNLRPGELDDFGLVAAARSACQDFELRTGITVKFTHSEFQERLPAALELSLYRIVQEALTNAEKYSGATDVEIDLTEADSYVLLEIADNGRGFEISNGPGTSSGLGLLHMRERATLVGGVFSLRSTPGHGVRITIHAPVNRTAEALHE